MLIASKCNVDCRILPRNAYQVQLDVVKGFALRQIVVVAGGKQAGLVPSDNSLCK